jgi:uncharacterized protein (DUF983 family)
MIKCCPACNSGNIHYVVMKSYWLCDSCGKYFFIPKEKIGVLI